MRDRRQRAVSAGITCTPTRRSRTPTCCTGRSSARTGMRSARPATPRTCARATTAPRNTYKTTWSEMDVSCEACHGPGSAHVAWADTAVARCASCGPEPDMGLTASRRSSRCQWTMQSAGHRAAQSGACTRQRAEVEICAPCHARRAERFDAHVPGQPLLMSYRPAFLSQNLYRADGQMQDEVYNYGSFLQSRMYAAGVTCADCHDPHSLKQRAAATPSARSVTCRRPSTWSRIMGTKPGGRARRVWRVTCRPRPTWVWTGGTTTASGFPAPISPNGSACPTRARSATRESARRGHRERSTSGSPDRGGGGRRSRGPSPKLAGDASPCRASGACERPAAAGDRARVSSGTAAGAFRRLSDRDTPGAHQ